MESVSCNRICGLSLLYCEKYEIQKGMARMIDEKGESWEK